MTAVQVYKQQSNNILIIFEARKYSKSKVNLSNLTANIFDSRSYVVHCHQKISIIFAKSKPDDNRFVFSSTAAEIHDAKLRVNIELYCS